MIGDAVMIDNMMIGIVVMIEDDVAMIDDDVVMIDDVVMML